MESWAQIDGDYRYVLGRRWDRDLPVVAFVMLNPSTADGTEDDPTIRRCRGYAQDWGFGALLVGNLYAYRATDPKALGRAKDPTGPAWEVTMASIAHAADLIVLAWGAHGMVLEGERAQVVTDLLLDWNFAPVSVLGLTKAGHPRHPLYLPRTAVPLNPVHLTRVALPRDAAE